MAKFSQLQGAGPKAKGEIVRVGDFDLPQGGFEITVEALDRIVENFKTYPRDLTLNYHHWGSARGRYSSACC